MSIDAILETAPPELQEVEATPDVVDTSNESNDSKETSSNETPKGEPRPTPKTRSIEELTKSPSDLTKEEARLIREKVEGKKAVAPEAPAKKDGLEKGEKKSDNTKASQPSKEADQAETDEDGDDADSELYKTIAPHIKPGDKDEAIKSIKNLHHELGRRGEIVNQLKGYGLDSKEKVNEALERMVNMDKAIEENLKSPEGIAKLQQLYGVQPSTQQTATAQTPAQQGAINVEEFIREVGNDEFIDGARFKKMLPTLANHIAQQFEQKYGSKVNELEGINQKFQTFMGAMMKRNQQQVELSNTFKDISTVASDYSKYEVGFGLTDSPEKIWAESVDPKTNRVLETPHPEFHKFKKIYGMVRESKQKGYPSVRAYIAEQLMSSGKLGEIQNNARRDVQQKFIEAKAKSLQPSIAGSKSSPKSSFIIPQSTSELKKLSAEQAKNLRKAVERGEVKTKFK